MTVFGCRKYCLEENVENEVTYLKKQMKILIYSQTLLIRKIGGGGGRSVMEIGCLS